jgi:hypothetical protein
MLDCRAVLEVKTQGLVERGPPWREGSGEVGQKRKPLKQARRALLESISAKTRHEAITISVRMDDKGIPQFLRKLAQLDKRSRARQIMVS